MNKACELCKGACCETFTMQLDGLKESRPDDYRWLQMHALTDTVGLRFECACSKLKDGKCSIYETRPEVCKKYKVGSIPCLHAIATRRAHQQKEILKLVKNELG